MSLAVSIARRWRYRAAIVPQARVIYDKVLVDVVAVNDEVYATHRVVEPGDKLQTFSDGLSSTGGVLGGGFDSLDLADTIILKKSKRVRLADSVDVVDTLNRSIAAHRAVAEAIAPDDDSQFTVTPFEPPSSIVNRIRKDVVVVVDDVEVTFLGTSLRSVLDTIDATDLIGLSITNLRRVSDDLIVSDEVDRRKLLNKRLLSRSEHSDDIIVSRQAAVNEVLIVESFAVTDDVVPGTIEQVAADTTILHGVAEY